MGGDRNSGISSDNGSSRHLRSVTLRIDPLKVKPPLATMASWQLALLYSLRNLEISSSVDCLAFGLQQMYAKFLT